jgi:hypothetical protein
MMTDLGITHTFETYQGEHGNKIPERIESTVLPFFSRNLAMKYRDVSRERPRNGCEIFGAAETHRRAANPQEDKTVL